jgi:putative ABC transport system substrate-binding protein
VNKRRQVIIALGGGALAASFSTFAQPQGKVWRIGFLVPRARPLSPDSVDYGSFIPALRELGYVEGKNLAVEWRAAEGKLDRLAGYAAELVKLNVDVIVTVGPQSTQAAVKATSTIPIVMVVSFDPVASGLVKSLAHPGGNVTGLSNFSVGLGPKHVEMLKSMVPKLSRLALLVNPSNLAQAPVIKSIEAAAQEFRVKVLHAQAQTSQEIESAFSMMAREKAGACIVILDPLFIQQRVQIADLAAKHRLPALSPFREFVEAGGLMSYGQNLPEQYRRMSTFVDKILKGAKPADLPVEQPTKLELFINGKTARALGLKIPQSLMISADKIVE